MTPYIVCMAYAVRVKLDAHLVRSHFLSKADRNRYLQRAVDIVEKFVKVIIQALNAMTTNASLLDIALDYHSSIMTYVALIKTLRSSAQAMQSPKAAPEETEMWNDGLAAIR